MEQRTTTLRRPGPFQLYDKPGFDGKERNISGEAQALGFDSLRFEILRRHVR
jgi:hypothetical protein